MYVCICKALTEKDVHTAVSQGCNSVRELKRTLGLGSECGRCASCAHSMLRNARETGINDGTAQLAAA